tara:strand:+ start:254 stop:1102 length:849 start_codon:yes stop_codon:yes gene_type:complete
MKKAVVSFGGGVQSTTLAWLVIKRDPRLAKIVTVWPTLFVFADTGDEPAEVYEHVERMRKVILDAGLDFATVKRKGRPLSEQFTHWRTLTSAPLVAPFFIKSKSGSVMPMRRYCTVHYKVKVIRKAIRQWAEVPRGYKGEAYVEEWLGISADEAQREKVSTRDDGYNCARAYRHPLLEMGWKRSHCHEYLDSIDESAPRSACTFCPFRSNAEWLEVKAKPDEWAQVIAVERGAQEAHREGRLNMAGAPYLHPSRIPIDEVDFDGGQQSLFGWDDECAGVCGV